MTAPRVRGRAVSLRRLIGYLARAGVYHLRSWRYHLRGWRHGFRAHYPAADRLADAFRALEHPGGCPNPPGRPGARRTGGWCERLLCKASLASGAALLLFAAVGLLIFTGRTAGAADVRRSAAAAEAAKTFAFGTRSVLVPVSGPTEETLQSGTVNLDTPAYRTRITTPAGRGFERIVFAHALFVRHLGVRRPGPWREIQLEQAAVIAPQLGAGQGIADPLAVLAVLRNSHGAKIVGYEQIGGVGATHFRLRSTLGAFLHAEHVTAPARLAGQPVILDVWLDSASRVLRARRLFVISGSPVKRLAITTDFIGYGRKVNLVMPPSTLHFYLKRLAAGAEDPLSTSVIGALLAGSSHPATPANEPLHTSSTVHR
jgi:hypothetical protein